MYCDKDYEKCVDTCEFNKANDCLMNCGRIFTMCVESCPCHTDCIQGCEGCPNPICYCNVSFDLISQYRIFLLFKKTLFRMSPKMKISRHAKTNSVLNLVTAFSNVSQKIKRVTFNDFHPTTMLPRDVLLVKKDARKISRTDF